MTRNNGTSFKARLYLDFDGVLNAKQPQHDDVAEFHIPIEGSANLAPVNHIVYSPHVVRELERFREQYGLELVWLTTWNESDHVLKLSPYLGGLADGRVLPAKLHTAQVGKREWTAWKGAAIVADQDASPSPFVWIDDNAHQFHGEFVQNQVNVDTIFITPNSSWGLTTENLNAIESFLQGVQ